MSFVGWCFEHNTWRTNPACENAHAEQQQTWAIQLAQEALKLSKLEEENSEESKAFRAKKLQQLRDNISYSSMGE